MSEDEGSDGEARHEREQDPPDDARIEPFLDMRDPTFRRILRSATSKFNQMICPLMASVCVRDLCMFWNDHSKSCYIVDTLKMNIYHTVCPKCGSTRTQPFTHAGPGARVNMKCTNCGHLFRGPTKS